MLAAYVAAVALTPPPGFLENAKLDARAEWIAKKPVRVYCATSDAVWQSFLTANNDTATGVDGATLTVGASETYLSPRACTPLLARLRRHAVTLSAFGAAIDVLAHESTHMKGTADEAQTECAAYNLVQPFLAQWGLRKGSNAYVQTFNGARNYHRALPPAYRSVC